LLVRDFGPLIAIMVGEPEPEPIPKFPGKVVPPNDRQEGLHLEASLGWSDSVVEVVVTKTGTEPVPDLSVRRVYAYETPQPPSCEAGPLQAVAGASFWLVTERAFGAGGALGLGRATVFAFGYQTMQDARGLVTVGLVAGPLLGVHFGLVFGGGPARQQRDRRRFQPGRGGWPEMIPDLASAAG
jgi:hypothetical protein